MSVRPPTPVTAPAAPQRPSDPGGFLWWAPIVAFVGAVFATSVVGLFLTGISSLKGKGDDALSPTALLISTYAQDVFFVLGAILCAKLTIERVRPATFGIRRFRPTKALWLVPALFVVFWAVLQIVGRLVDSDAEQSLPTDLGADDGQLGPVIGLALLVCVFAPVAEEILFRGFLFKALERSIGWIIAAIVSGLAFGGVHALGTPVAFLFPLAVFGFVLCVVYRFTGSILPTMGMHALNNGIALGTLLDWSVQGTVASAVLAPALVVGAAYLVARE